ncbi:hypothetical protein OKW37_004044 [Paraburkholderia sp. MM5482-R2]
MSFRNAPTCSLFIAPRFQFYPGDNHCDAGGYVSGYTRSNGTYVAGHHQTNPNGTKYDNWSSKGNVNPYTGKEGTVDPSK